MLKSKWFWIAVAVLILAPSLGVALVNLAISLIEALIHNAQQYGPQIHPPTVAPTK